MKTWFAIYEGRPLLNGDKVKDDDGNFYTFLFFTAPDDGIGGQAGTGGFVTVKNFAGKLIRTTRFPFSITFQFEVNDER